MWWQALSKKCEKTNLNEIQRKTCVGDIGSPQFCPEILGISSELRPRNPSLKRFFGMDFLTRAEQKSSDGLQGYDTILFPDRLKMVSRVGMWV